jgi:hypothetical protein
MAFSSAFGSREENASKQKGSPGAAQADLREIRPDKKALPGVPTGRGFLF